MSREPLESSPCRIFESAATSRRICGKAKPLAVVSRGLSSGTKIATVSGGSRIRMEQHRLGFPIEQAGPPRRAY